MKSSTLLLEFKKTNVCDRKNVYNIRIKVILHIILDFVVLICIFR
ncbi:unnamed protein product, partial [Arabidopsis halleri]